MFLFKAITHCLTGVLEKKGTNYLILKNIIFKYKIQS